MQSVEKRSDELDKRILDLPRDYTRRKVVDAFLAVIILLIIFFALTIIHKENTIIHLLRGV